MKNEFDLLNDVNVDFSMYNITDISEEEFYNMKKFLSEKNSKKIAFKRCIIAAVCISSLTAVSQTAFAKDFISNIIKTFTTGKNEFVQVAPIVVPETLKGKVFDKNGNPIESFINGDDIYDINGNKVDISFQNKDENGNPIYSLEIADNYSIAKEIPESDESGVVFTDIQKAKDVLGFSPLFPRKLPDGYKFFYARIPYSPVENSKGYLSKNYVTLVYSNGEQTINIVQSMGFSYKISIPGELRETNVNGHSAVYSKNQINWENDNISFFIISSAELSAETLIEIAENLK